MKAYSLGLTLALLAGTAPHSSAQDSQPTSRPAAAKQARIDPLPKPARLGGNRLSGIKAKKKAPQVQAPASRAATPKFGGAMPIVEGPVLRDAKSPGKGGLFFEPGSQVFDFGDMTQGDRSSTAFKVKSSGADPLVITNVTKSCGCTRAEVTMFGPDGLKHSYKMGDPIEPGAEFLIEANIDTTGKSHAFKSEVTLHTNDPRQGIVFTLKANVRAALALNPRTLNMATLKATDFKKGQVVITSEAFGKFKLAVDSSITLEKVKVELSPTNPDENGRSDRWIAKVEVGPNLAEGVLNRAIRLVSDLPQSNKTQPDGSPLYFDVVLFVVGNVLGPVSINPQHVSFGLLRPGQTATRKVLIRIADPDFSITEAPRWSLQGYGTELENPEDFAVSILPVEGSKDWEMSITLLGIDEQKGNGIFRGLVEIELGHPAKPVLEIGFTGVIRGGVTKSGSGQ